MFYKLLADSVYVKLTAKLDLNVILLHLYYKNAQCILWYCSFLLFLPNKGSANRKVTGGDGEKQQKYCARQEEQKASGAEKQIHARRKFPQTQPSPPPSLF